MPHRDTGTHCGGWWEQGWRENGLNFKLCFNRQFTVAFFISYGKISFSAEKKNKLFYIILRFTFQTQVGFVPNLISLILAIAGH